MKYTISYLFENDQHKAEVNEVPLGNELMFEIYPLDGLHVKIFGARQIIRWIPEEVAYRYDLTNKVHEAKQFLYSLAEGLEKHTQRGSVNPA